MSTASAPARVCMHRNKCVKKASVRLGVAVISVLMDEDDEAACFFDGASPAASAGFPEGSIETGSTFVSVFASVISIIFAQAIKALMLLLL